jgi:hypothetical protein
MQDGLQYIKQAANILSGRQHILVSASKMAPTLLFKHAIKYLNPAPREDHKAPSILQDILYDQNPISKLVGQFLNPKIQTASVKKFSQADTTLALNTFYQTYHQTSQEIGGLDALVEKLFTDNTSKLERVFTQIQILQELNLDPQSFSDHLSKASGYIQMLQTFIPSHSINLLAEILYNDPSITKDLIRIINRTNVGGLRLLSTGEFYQFLQQNHLILPHEETQVLKGLMNKHFPDFESVLTLLCSLSEMQIPSTNQPNFQSPTKKELYALVNLFIANKELVAGHLNSMNEECWKNLSNAVKDADESCLEALRLLLQEEKLMTSPKSELESILYAAKLHQHVSKSEKLINLLACIHEVIKVKINLLPSSLLPVAHHITTLVEQFTSNESFKRKLVLALKPPEAFAKLVTDNVKTILTILASRRSLRAFRVFILGLVIALAVLSIIGSPIAAPVGATILGILGLTALVISGVGIRNAYYLHSLKKELYNYVGKHILNTPQLLIQSKKHAQVTKDAIGKLKQDHPEIDLTDACNKIQSQKIIVGYSAYGVDKYDYILGYTQTNRSNNLATIATLIEPNQQELEGSPQTIKDSKLIHKLSKKVILSSDGILVNLLHLRLLPHVSTTPTSLSSYVKNNILPSNTTSSRTHDREEGPSYRR